MSDDPTYYHRSQDTKAWPPRPMWVTGHTFNPTTRVVDFSAVPGFDLSRLIDLTHVKSGKVLYARPYAPPLGLAMVDGVAVPAQPTSGSVLKVKADCTAMLAADEIFARYDLPAGDPALDRPQL